MMSRFFVALFATCLPIAAFIVAEFMCNQKVSIGQQPLFAVSDPRADALSPDVWRQ